MSALIELSDIKSWLGLEGAKTARDTFLTSMCTAWSAKFERRIGRTISQATYTDEIHDGRRFVILPRNYPVQSITSLTIDGVALGSTYYYLNASGMIIRQKNGLRFGGGRGSIKLTYIGGYATVPEDIKQALIQIVALDYYLSGHGNSLLPKTAEALNDGERLTYNRSPKDQERMLQDIVTIYRRHA